MKNFSSFKKSIVVSGTRYQNSFQENLKTNSKKDFSSSENNKTKKALN